MKLKDSLEIAIIYLGLDNLLKTNVFKTDGTTPTIAENAEINLLTRCANLVIEEIAMDYIPLLKTKEITLSDNKILLSSIDEKLMEIISVEKNSEKIKFKEFDNYLHANAEKVMVTYRIYPPTLTPTDDLVTFNNKVSARVIAFGIAMEYCFISTLSDDAIIFEKRYKDALSEIVRLRKNIVMPKRRWL